jgi:hypothetical protein
VPEAPNPEDAPGWEGLVGNLRRHVVPLLRLRIPVVRLEGADRNMVVAGDGAAVRYLVRRFFREEPRRRVLFHAPLPALPKALQECAADADLALARVERPAARRLFDARFFRVPEAVDAYVAITDDPSDLTRASKTAKHNTRVVREHGLTWTVSHAPADFDDFYRRMYLPYARRRFGEAAFIRGRRVMARDFRHGGILWIRRDDATIAGGLFRVREDRMSLRGSPGTAEGGTEPVRAGALSALYLFSAEYARLHGLRRLNFGASLPSLEDGALRYKRSWGATLCDRAQSHHDLVLRWNRASPAVRAFLRETPLVVREGTGFAAVTAVGADAPESVGRLVRGLATPGVDRLLVMVPDGWETPPLPDGLRDVTRAWRCPEGPPEDIARSAAPMW